MCSVFKYNDRISFFILQPVLGTKLISVFRTRGARKQIYRVLFLSDSLSSVWGYSVHFAKFPMWIFSNGYCPHSFHSILTFMGSMVIKEEYTLLLFGWSDKFKNTFMAAWNVLLIRDHMMLEISKCYPPLHYGFHSMSQTSWGHWYGGIKAVAFLANRTSFTILWHFELLTWSAFEDCKCAITWKRLIVKWNGWKYGDSRY